ncbi:hypothetical protein EJ110_NYTH32452 [Nymphaea thermarum]|nr:hypothetical protein EJ110_NYTH32452 [Nymphaea thermarum]
MGGGTMRAVGRVFGVGAVRGGAVIPRMQQPSGVRRSSYPSSTPVSSAGDGDKGKVVVSSPGNAETSVARGASWENDDWEFADCDLFEPEIPPPRFVFGPPASWEEAVKATEELKETVNKMYFVSPTDGSVAPHALETSKASEELMLNEPDTKLCVANGHAVIAPPMNNNVLQAFSLLNERPDVQNMVVSLASDPNIWEAVLNNKKVLQFCQSNNTSLFTKDAAESVSISENFESLGVDDPTSDGKEGGFQTFLREMKLKMSEFIGKVSEVALSFIGLGPKEGSRDANKDFVETAVKTSFMLAVVVIFVVVLKRMP